MSENEQDSPPTRRRGVKRLIDQPFTAKLIASQLSIRVEQLRSNGQEAGEPDYRRPAETTADNDLADLLATAADELRAVS
jgi:hypothetical protein